MTRIVSTIALRTIADDVGLRTIAKAVVLRAIVSELSRTVLRTIAFIITWSIVVRTIVVRTIALSFLEQ